MKAIHVLQCNDVVTDNNIFYHASLYILTVELYNKCIIFSNRTMTVQRLCEDFPVSISVNSFHSNIVFFLSIFILMVDRCTLDCIRITNII